MWVPPLGISKVLSSGRSTLSVPGYTAPLSWNQNLKKTLHSFRCRGRNSTLIMRLKFIWFCCFVFSAQGRQTKSSSCTSSEAQRSSSSSSASSEATSSATHMKLSLKESSLTKAEDAQPVDREPSSTGSDVWVTETKEFGKAYSLKTSTASQTENVFDDGGQRPQLLWKSEFKGRTVRQLLLQASLSRVCKTFFLTFFVTWL